MSQYHRFTSLALLFALLIEPACKHRTANDAMISGGRGATPPTAEETPAEQVETLPPAERVSADDLQLSLLDPASLWLADLRMPLVAYEPNPLQDYVSYSFCRLDRARACTVGRSADATFVVPDLAAGTYELKLRACVVPGRVLDEPCGPELKRYFEQATAPEATVNGLFKERLALSEAIIGQAKAVELRLEEYKNGQITTGPAPDDELERSVNNILALGPYKNSLVYQSEEFDVFAAEASEAPSANSATTSFGLAGEGPFASSEEAAPRGGKANEQKAPVGKSPLGYVMLIGGVITIGAGLWFLPHLNPNKPQAVLSSIDEAMGEAKSADRIKYLEKGRAEWTQKAETFSEKKFKDKRRMGTFKGIGLILAGLAVMAVGFSLPLTEPTGIDALRQELMRGLAQHEATLLELKKRLSRVNARLDELVEARN